MLIILSFICKQSVNKITQKETLEKGHLQKVI